MPSPIRMLEEGNAEVLASLPHLAERIANLAKLAGKDGSDGKIRDPAEA